MGERKNMTKSEQLRMKILHNAKKIAQGAPSARRVAFWVSYYLQLTI